jgi:hypothetical protein
LNVTYRLWTVPTVVVALLIGVAITAVLFMGGSFFHAREEGGQTPDEAAASLVPLTEMTAQDEYKGEDGGLYGGGKNEPPEAHQAAAQEELAKITPLDAQGEPSEDGKIILLSIGMSNTTREFSRFEEVAEEDPQKSPHVTVVDGAQGGNGAEEWAEENVERVWAKVNRRLKRAGVTPEQVQAIWLKQAVRRPKPGDFLDFLENARALQGHLTTILNRATTSFPNLRVAYLSSRSYGGYSRKHAEPESYETAFSVRWVIQEQIDGAPELNYDPARGEVKAPLVLWGPYLWANGTTPRKSDGLVWEPADFVRDGPHPSDSGREKVVEMLLSFFKSDPNACTWFVKPWCIAKSAT